MLGGIMGFSRLSQFILVIFVITAGPALGAERVRLLESADSVYLGAVARADKSTDTLQVYGGPATVEGRFQDAVDPNLPDWQGWIGRDNSIDFEFHWNIDDYNCANLDPATPGNHAWWCGDDFPACDVDDPAGGYGNGWDQRLEWRGAAPDTGSGVDVRVRAVLNYDVEPSYDYLTLEYARYLERTIVASFDGQGAAVAVDEIFTVPDTWYVGGEIVLRWRVESDGGWSDEDCQWPTAGAAQIDLIEVSYHGDDGWVRIGEIEDCEPTSLVQWSTTPPVGVGCFAKIWPQLDDIDPCNSNTTAQAAFIDDGVVVPGTGGSWNGVWTYGPGEYVVNDTGGLIGGFAHLDNSIESPPIAWPAGYQGCILAFDVWSHQPLDSCMFRNWLVSSTTDPTGLAGWTEWRDHSFVYYSDQPRYRRMIHDVSDLILPDAACVRVRLGVLELGWVWGWEDGDATPAPYYDNVSLKAYRMPGPWIAASEVELPQDAFPEAGVIDPLDPAAASVRFDMAENVADSDPTQIARHDSVTVTIDVLRGGATLVGVPKMHYRLFPNPVFDGVRTAGLPAQGVVDGMETYVANRWAFDLPDTGFFFPGDVIHVCFSATDDAGGDVRTAVLPADTTGFGVGPRDPAYDPLLYPEAFTVRALPAVTKLSPLEHPPTLYWDDSGSEETRRCWIDGLDAAYRNRALYDIYVTNAPASILGNGLGAHATPELLSGYATIVYAGGTLMQGSIHSTDPSPDAAILNDWLDLSERPQGLVLTGNDLVNALNDLGDAEAVLLERMGVVDVATDITPLIDDQPAPWVLVEEPGGPLDGIGWRIATECPEDATHNATSSDTQDGRLAEYMDPSGAVGVYAYSGLTRAESDDDVILTLPYDLRFVSDVTVQDTSAAAALVSRLMLMAGFSDQYGEIARTPGVFSAAIAPNPFNPMTRIFYTAAQRGRLTIDVFNLRGEKVRRLHDAVVEAGPGVVEWNGRDDRGADVASGVYFCRVASGRDREILKVALVR